MAAEARFDDRANRRDIVVLYGHCQYAPASVRTVWGAREGSGEEPVRGIGTG